MLWSQGKTGKELAPSQREALKQALPSRVLVPTGGPGVVLPTLVNTILLILRARKVRCLLCAPAGRATKRLSEATGIEAKTIHRLLEVQPATGAVTRKEGQPSAQYTSTSTAACSADFTTSSNFLSLAFGSLSLADTSGTDSRNWHHWHEKC